MVDRKQHILLDGFSTNENFRSRNTGRNPEVPEKDRLAHGAFLFGRYSTVLSEYDARRQSIAEPISEDVGIYVEIIGQQGVKLPLTSLDNRDFKLCSCKFENDREVAVVFVPERRRESFHRKITQYLTEETRSKKPKNRPLVDSIADIRLAALKDFWTDDESLFPHDENEIFWWEVWIKVKKDFEIGTFVQSLAHKLQARVGNTSLRFYDSAVFLLEASRTQLNTIPDLISNLEELRRAKETPNVFLDSSAKDQMQWANNLLERLQIDQDASVAVTILDTGVNYHHPLIAPVCNESQASVWLPEWPHFGSYNKQNADDHGSRQAGLAIFGDVQEALVQNHPIFVCHKIESGRILPPRGGNDPELYGAITVGTASMFEAERPTWRRVYSLAVTAPIGDKEGGLPTSWSSEIDLFCSGMVDDYQRLFVISAGNNRNLDPAVDYWDQLHLSQIEDPAQAWNALTVGAFTEKTTNDDPLFAGWSPLAKSGDVAPASRSSVNWSFRNQAAYKPDVVAEGGNRLLSPDCTEITNADVVSLLTTSGNVTGQLFEVTADTSAATAITSRQAAILMATYPDFWPETIRGLLVHSAQWTKRMWHRFGDLQRGHSPKRAKEIMLRSFGYGVVDLERAQYSAKHALTLIAQDSIQPFFKEQEDTPSSDPKLHEMQLYSLPWPSDVLLRLPAETEVKLRVTLSYFIEPNPGRHGYRQRYSYQSHGLRFAMIRPGQSVENFRHSINAIANSDDEYAGPEGDADGWTFGTHLRTRGSLHSDVWTGSAAALADMHTIAVYPVGGWWKYRTAEERWQKEARYSLIVSIDLPDESVDIYSVVQNIVSTQVDVLV